jgi:cytoskeletal protein RodZ
MTFPEIRKLLDKYWKGESTLKEEEQLKAFFQAHRESLPQDMQGAAKLFSFYEKESERTSDGIRHPEKLTEKKEKPKSRISFYWKYAAVFILLLAGAFFYRFAIYQSPEKATDSQYTQQEISQAFETTQKALQTVADNLHTGKKEMLTLALFNEMQKKVAEN